MFTFILYSVIYFVIGFGFAKFKKYCDEVDNILPKTRPEQYATIGLLWLPYAAYYGVVKVIVYIHGVYSSKL